MPGKVGVKIKAGRNLPVMDRGSDTTDAYVEIKLGTVTHKTDVCRKSLNPQWNTDWFRFEVDDAELQDEPLQIRLMDHDTYSANDAIGKVNISLNPLCLETAGQSTQGKGAVMSGWIPVFDTMHGIRGEVNIIVKVDLFSDVNKFRQSSCGIQFFHSPCIPHGYRAQIIHGFVEELVVNDDPEYQWIDKIRTPRASNEARQTVFLKLSGQVQRKIGLKAINLGANAVIGYIQCFDLEGDVGVVARGIGTAVTLLKIQENVTQPSVDNALIEERTMKYLEFLKGGNTWIDPSKSKFDSDYLENDPCDVVYKILGIDPLDKCSARSPNIILKKRWKPSSRDPIIFEENMSETELNMRQLLHQEDMRGEKPTRKFHHNVKKLTHSSKNLLNEKFNAFRWKKSDEKISEYDAKSLNSSYSDLSISESVRSSLTDLRNLMRFKKSKKQQKFHRSVSDGSSMATILVSSIIRGPSLDSISEVHDSPRAIPVKKRQRTDSKSESMSNLLPSSLEDAAQTTRKDLKSESMGNIPTLNSKRHYLVPTLRQNAVVGNQSSDNSISSVSVSSSTTTEEGFSDENSETTTPNEVLVFDPDTVSMVVKSVLAKECEDKDSHNWIQPGSCQDEDDHIKPKEKTPTFAEKNLENILQAKARSLSKQQSSDSSNSSTSTAIVAVNPINKKIYQQQPDHFITTGATRILRKDKNAKITESTIIESDTTHKKLETMLKQPSLDEDVDKWIEPGSTTDEPETIDRGRRPSLLHDLRENITERFHHLQGHMHMPHFSDDRNKIIHKHGLLETAMETMLVDKANILGVQSQQTTSNNEELSSEHVEHSVHDNSHNDKGHSKRRASIDLIIRTLHLPIGHGHHHNQSHPKTPDGEIKNESGLLGTAMRSMLIENLNFAEEICHEQNQQQTDHGKFTPNESDIDEDDEFVTFEVHKETVKDFTEIELPHPLLDVTRGNLKEQTLKVSNEFKEIDLSDLDEITKGNLKDQSTFKNDGNYYSSDPHLGQTIELLSPSNYLDTPAPFLSLTNLSMNSSIDDEYNNDSVNKDAAYNKNNYRKIEIHTNNTISSTKYQQLQVPKAIIIHPSTPSTSPDSPPFDSFIHPSIEQLFLDVMLKNTNTIVQHNNNCLVDNYCIHNSLDANISHENNNIISSYTNLLSSCTNKAQTLTPSAPYLNQQLRSSTELVASGSSVGVNPVIGGAATQSPLAIQQKTNDTQVPVTDTAVANIKAESTLSPVQINQGHIRTESVGNRMSSPAKPNTGSTTGSTTIPNSKNSEIFRRSSDSDLSVTPKGNSICVASDRLVAATTMMRLTAAPTSKIVNACENIDMLEYPFLTLGKYPSGFILHLGATVAARSVKLLERVPNPDEPETRDSWWTELRMEIRSHARALGCNVILGYSEVTTISDDVCVLSATGTAAVINMSYSGESSQLDFLSCIKKDAIVSSLDERECLREVKNSGKDIGEFLTKDLSSSYGGTTKTFLNSHYHNKGCAMCHIPYTTTTVPVNIKMKKCAICKRGKVPDVLLSTLEIPECLQITGRGCFMQAQVVRAKKDLRSESNAKEISDGLPFLEYELHRLLINKLKAKGMNAIFGLKAHVAIGEKMMALIATGTAVFLTALPPPTVPKIVAGNSWNDTARLNDLQKSLQETVEKNREIYQLKCMDPDLQQNGKQSDTDDSDDELLELDLNAGSKDTCVLEVDDIEDLEIISLLMESCPPEGFHVVNTQSVPGLQDMEVVRNLQMFTQVWRAKISVGQNSGGFPKHFQRLLQTIYFKLRTMIPCAVCDLKFRLDLPESDEIQILVTGMALGLGEPTKLTKLRRKTISSNQIIEMPTNGLQNKKSTDEELIFNLEDDQIDNNGSSNLQYGSHSLRLKKNSPSRTKFTSVRYSRHLPLHDRYGVDVTPLSYVPGGKIEKYLGNLNFFFIRESTSIRENGGISGFVHSFITELLAVVRAHISALGGNAMVSFYMTELILVDNQHKNQGQCLISIGGDVVFVSYFADD